MSWLKKEEDDHVSPVTGTVKWASVEKKPGQNFLVPVRPDPNRPPLHFQGPPLVLQLTIPIFLPRFILCKMADMGRNFRVSTTAFGYNRKQFKSYHYRGCPKYSYCLSSHTHTHTHMRVHAYTKTHAYLCTQKHTPMRVHAYTLKMFFPPALVFFCDPSLKLASIELQSFSFYMTDILTPA